MIEPSTTEVETDRNPVLGTETDVLTAGSDKELSPSEGLQMLRENETSPDETLGTDHFTFYLLLLRIFVYRRMVIFLNFRTPIKF